MKLYIHTSLQPEGVIAIRQELEKNHDIAFASELGESRMKEAFEEAEVVMGNPPVEWWENRDKPVFFWQLDSAGFDQYSHLNNVSEKIANMGDFFAQPCAETLVGGVLSFYRGLPELVKLQAEKNWKGKLLRPHLELLGEKKVLVLGAGSIGLLIKRMLEGFGCKVEVLARTNPAATILSKESAYQALPELDLVMNTLPGSADCFVDKAFLQSMKPGSLYASVGRGNTTDEAALLAALRAGHLSGAVLDVTETEPLPEEHPFWEMKNVLLLQHTGGGRPGEEEGKMGRFLLNFSNMLQQQPLEDEITLEKGY